MSVITAGLCLVGALCLLDLLLTFGVIRRLREHSTLLADRPGGGQPSAVMMAPGGRPAEFVATSDGGDSITLANAGRLVGFFLADCDPCKERVPQFIDYARQLPGGRDAIVSVLVGEPEAVQEYADQLRAVSRVVFEDSSEGPMSRAFEVRGFPALGLIGRDGLVEASGSVFAALPPARTLAVQR